MAFLYHRVPEEMRGTELYPLNVLKNVYPDLYQKYVSKYADRPHVPKNRIPQLDNCLWNDVLHFTALSPGIIYEELAKIENKKRSARYYRFDVHLLESEKTVVYLFPIREQGMVTKADDFIAYNPDLIEQYAYLPQETIVYFKETIAQNKRPLLYRGVPHILYKGTLDITKATSIEI